MSNRLKKLTGVSAIVGAVALILFLVLPTAPTTTACASVSAKNKALCYTDVIDQMLKQKGLSATFDFIAATYEADPSFAKFCHANTHDLGKAAYIDFHATGEVDLSPKASYCGYGFYHGFMEEMLFQTHNLTEAREFCTYASTVVPIPEGYAEGACYHGIGHGVTDGYDTTLWGDAKALTAPGLKLCREVALTTDWRYRCASGVFNSIALLHRDPTYKLSVAGDPYKLCRTSTYDEIEQSACYSQMDTLVAFVAKSFAEAIGYASGVKEEYRDSATLNAASIVVQRLRREPTGTVPKEAVAVCGPLPESQRVACVRGLVDGVIEHGSPQNQYKEVLALCDADIGVLAEPCYERLVQNISTFYSGALLESACGSLPEAYRSRCITPR